jgi:hypothetical protein
MDIAYQYEGKYDVCKPEYPHEEGKLEEPGDKTDHEKYTHSEIKAPSDNLHIHDYHTLSDIYRFFAVIGDGTCGSGSGCVSIVHPAGTCRCPEFTKWCPGS